MKPVNEFKKKRIIRFLSEISNETSNIPFLGKDKLEYIFKKSLDLLNLPLPNGEIYDYFLMPEIIMIFLDNLYYSILRKENVKLDNKIQLHDILNRERGKSVKYRVLGEKGTYPNCELERENCKYTIVNSIPVLITEDESYYWGDTLSIPINRNELRVATCAMLAPTSGIGCFMFTNDFTDYNILTIKKEILDKVPEKLQVYFLHQLLQYENLMRFRDDIYRLDPFDSLSYVYTFSNAEIMTDPSKYNFIAFYRYTENFNNLFDHFNTRNRLLLKTSYYFIKASMLMYSNLSFAEEATANALFCLEGCMHLIQKKYGIKGTRLDLQKLQPIFKNNLPRGEELFEYMQEFYDKRNELVHAEMDWGTEWPIPLYSEDLPESIELCRKLLNFILIDRRIEDEKEKEMNEFVHEFYDLEESKNERKEDKG